MLTISMFLFAISLGTRKCQTWCEICFLFVKVLLDTCIKYLKSLLAYSLINSRASYYYYYYYYYYIDFNKIIKINKFS
jgi:hypothetical protein